MAALVTAAPLTPHELEATSSPPSRTCPRKAWPRYVRIVGTLPRTATNKVLKRELAAEGPVSGDGVLWERRPRGRTYADHR